MRLRPSKLRPSKLRPSRLPPEIAARLAPHERALAFTAIRGGGWLVGTRSALSILSPETTRLAWEQVQAADWDRDESRLTVSEIGSYGEARPVHRFDFAGEPTLLLQLVRERVSASIVVQRRFTVSGRRGFTVIARRSPVGGPLMWMQEYDAGIDPDDPEVIALSERAVAEAQTEFGAI